MPSQKMLDRVDEIAEFLAILGNGKRLAIMLHLLDKEMPVGAIAQKVELSQSALSQHLAKLRALNLVDTRRERQMIYYSCSAPRVRALFETLEGL
jgi:DNA-binding transcriptional ArsR family regulator